MRSWLGSVIRIVGSAVFIGVGSASQDGSQEAVLIGIGIWLSVVELIVRAEMEEF